MLNIDVGGSLRSNELSSEVVKNWKILDIGGVYKGNVTQFQHDLNSGRPFPFENNTVDNYYTSNTLEHIYGYNQSFIFSELYRTLKPKGRIRIVVPDFEKLLNLYLTKRLSRGGTFQPNCRINTQLGRLISWVSVLGCCNPKDKKAHAKEDMGHKTGFDWETLQYFLQQAGFIDIILSEYAKCSKIFVGKDLSLYKKKGVSIYIEAQK